MYLPQSSGKPPRNPTTVVRELVKYRKQNADEIREGAAQLSKLSNYCETSIDEIELGVRTYSLLRKAGIRTAEELACYPMSLFGPKTQREIVENLQSLGII